MDYVGNWVAWHRGCVVCVSQIFTWIARVTWVKIFFKWVIIFTCVAWVKYIFVWVKFFCVSPDFFSWVKIVYVGPIFLCVGQLLFTRRDYFTIL